MKRWLAYATLILATAGGVAVFDQTIGANILGTRNWGFVTELLAQTPLPLPRPAPAAIQVAAAPTSSPPRFETVVYDAWTVTCREGGPTSSKKQCSAYFQVIEQKNRQILLTWSIGKSDNGSLVTSMQTPTGIQVRKGVDLKFGEAKPHNLSYTVCLPQRCEAVMSLDEALLREATKSGNAVATVYAADGRNINFNMSIKGIDQALAAVVQ